MKGILTFLSLLCYFISYSQSLCDYRFDHIWIMGDADTDTIHTDIYGGCEINFNNSPPTYDFHPKGAGISFQNATMSSKEGDLIFYSNGCSVFNKYDMIMDNGDSLNPGEIYKFGCPTSGYVGYQNMIAIPDSYNDSIYYLFYISLQFNPKPNPTIPIQSQFLYYTKINSYLNSGLGKVLEKNFPIIADTNLITTPLTAVKHANGLDWWLITPDRWGNSFNIILLNKSGPQNIGKQSIGTNTNPHAEGGQGKFSPSGDHFAWYHPKNGLFLYKFNRENGVLSHFEHFDIPFANFIIGGCEFSPNGRFLYVSHDTSLFQLDLLDENIQSRLVRIADFDGFGDPLPTAFFFMERTPDNKIIVNAINGSQYLHVIQEPNKKGLACHFEQHSIMLPTINNFTLPHFPNYRLGALSDPTCDSLNVIVDNPLANFNISIFPNPATDWIYISNGEQVETFSWIYFIYNLNGQLLKVSDENVIDVRDFAEGLYLLRILGKNAPSNTIQFIKTSLN